MRRTVLLSALLCLWAVSAWAQQNTFPPTGNVGIGTTAPLACPGCSATALEVSGDNAAIRLSDRTGPVKADFLLSSNDGELRVTRIPTAGFPAGFLVLTSNGNLGLGVTDPAEKLEIQGVVKAEGLIVPSSGGADHVLRPNHELTPLVELETFIGEVGHLPGIPSASVMEREGVEVGEMQMLLLAKVEELTLYILELNREVKNLRAQVEEVPQQTRR